MQRIISTTLDFFPDIEGIYLFGSAFTKYETKDSDTEIEIIIDIIENNLEDIIEFSNIILKLI